MQARILYFYTSVFINTIFYKLSKEKFKLYYNKNER